MGVSRKCAPSAHMYGGHGKCAPSAHIFRARYDKKCAFGAYLLGCLETVRLRRTVSGRVTIKNAPSAHIYWGAWKLCAFGAHFQGALR